MYRAQQFNGEVTTFVNRYQQLYRGVPVFGGNMVINQQFYSCRLFNYTVAGKASPNLNVDVTPTLSAEEAVQIAHQMVAKVHGQNASILSTAEPSLWIYDERLFTSPALPAQLVWKVEVRGTGERPFHEVMLINAHNGKLAIRYDRLDEGWNLKPKDKKAIEPSAQQSIGEKSIEALSGGIADWEVYGAGNNYDNTDNFLVCDNSSPDCSGYSSASSSVGVNDADEAKQHLINTYNFFWTKVGRDSIDNAGMTLTAVVDYGDAYEDSWWWWLLANAYWDGTQMTFSDLFTTDDVTAHELTHGVTQNTAGLYYIYQSGAINESISDVFGELVDLSYNSDRISGADTYYRWLVGEDIAAPLGYLWVIRSMKNPPAYGDPDSMTSPKYYKGPYGGVHTNSGVNNKAAYLMVEGGNFNYKTVSPLGIDKVAALYYKVLTTYLFPSANYYDLYLALNNACQAMALVNEAGFTATDCQEVKDATEAVKMHIRPAAITGVMAPSCPPGLYYAQNLFQDDFEGGFAQWVGRVNKEGSYSTYTPDSTVGIIGDASNIVLTLQGPPEVANGSISYAEEFVTTANPIGLPLNEKIYLTFTHLYLFEAFHVGTIKDNHDGGVVEYSLDNGATWLDMKPLFNGGVNYNGKISPEFVFPIGPSLPNPNPLAGRLAFVANGRQTPTRMRYNLTPLAGQSILIRFHAGYDSYTDWGWFIDDVDIHTCTPAPPKPALKLPVQNALIHPTVSTVNLDWSDVTPTYLLEYKVQVDDNSDFSSPLLDTTTGTVSSYSLPMSSLTPNTKYYWRVASYNPYHQTAGWTATRAFRIAVTAPVNLTPGGGTTIGTLTPTLNWDDVSGATSYTVQVSLSPTFGTLLKNVTVYTSDYTFTTSLPAGKTIYWRVRANAANGPSQWSTESFITP